MLKKPWAKTAPRVAQRKSSKAVIVIVQHTAHRIPVIPHGALLVAFRLRGTLLLLRLVSPSCTTCKPLCS